MKQSPKKIFMLAFEGCQAVDVIGPTDAYSLANEVVLDKGADGPAYEVSLLTRRKGRFKTSSSVDLHSDKSFLTIKNEELRECDTLMIAGGLMAASARRDREFIGFIRRSNNHIKRIASVCTGAFLLAEAGLLSGRKATTHWMSINNFSKEYPDVKIQPDSIFVRDENVWSSAGITTGIDMTLAMIEADLGKKISTEVARIMVAYMTRQGEHVQLTNSISRNHVANDKIKDVIDLIKTNLSEDLAVDKLARHAAMSPRSFIRQFNKVIGTTPAKHVQECRIAMVQLLLETSSLSLKSIANDCSYSSTEVLRQVFRRRFAMTPKMYKEHFGRSINA